MKRRNFLALGVTALAAIPAGLRAFALPASPAAATIAPPVAPAIVRGTNFGVLTPEAKMLWSRSFWNDVRNPGPSLRDLIRHGGPIEPARRERKPAFYAKRHARKHRRQR